MLDGGLAHAPAEQHHLVVDPAWKIDKTGVEILDLHADGIDFGDAFAGALQMVVEVRAQAGYMADVNPHAAGKVNAPRQFREPRIYSLGRLLAINGALEQRFDHRQQRLRL